MKFRVWESCYLDSYVDVEAKDSDEAINQGVAKFKGSHHGEVTEIQAHNLDRHYTTRRLVRMPRSAR
jgi:hypothetical protein